MCVPGIKKAEQGEVRPRRDIGGRWSRTVCSSPAPSRGRCGRRRGLVRPPKFGEADMYRALSLLSGHIDDIQAGVYACSVRFMERRDRVIYYDCTNYYFEIEDNDRDTVDIETGELVAGLRKRGKSKENRPSPIVQMGMFMDMDGIPLAFVVFLDIESEQATLQPLEDVLRRKFGLTEMAINDDVLGQEERLDGFYAYATSLDDEATLVLKARSFHHEIGHPVPHHKDPPRGPARLPPGRTASAPTSSSASSPCCCPSSCKSSWPTRSPRPTRSTPCPSTS